MDALIELMREVTEQVVQRYVTVLLQGQLFNTLLIVYFGVLLAMGLSYYAGTRRKR